MGDSNQHLSKRLEKLLSARVGEHFEKSSAVRPVGVLRANGLTTVPDILNSQLLCYRRHRIHLCDRSVNERRVHGDGTIELRIEPEAAGDRMNVAVEGEPDDAPLRVHHGTA